jgi:hypothetical protein
MSSSTKLIIRIVILLLPVAIVACTSSLTRITPALTPTSMPSVTTTIAVSSPTNEPGFIPLLRQPTPTDVIGGGVTGSGPFRFDLRLFYDASLNQQPVATSLYSDMNGIGSFMYWCYQGSEPIGPIETYWGTVPQLNQLLQETYESIQPGSCGGRTGGILLPGGFFISGESKVGDRVQVALKVRTGDKEFGAVISFTLTQGPNGFEPTNISVTPLQ